MGSRYQPQVLLDLEFLGMMRTSVSDLQSVAKCSLAALEDAQRLLDAVDMARTLPLFVDWSEAEYRDTGYAQR